MKNFAQSLSVAKPMKTSPLRAHSKVLASFVGAAACLILSTSAQAVTATAYFWDADGVGASGTNTSLGGTGTWDSTSALWWNGTTYNTWNNLGGTTGSIAFIKGTAGTVTIADGGVTVGCDLDATNKNTNAAVTVSTAGYTLKGGPLTYDGTGSLVDAIIYHLTGSGNLTLNNDTIVKTFGPAGTANINTKFLVADGAGTVTVNGNIGLASTETAGTKVFEFKGGSPGVTIELNGTIKDYASTGSGAKLAVTMADIGTNQILKLTGVNTFSGGVQVRGGTVLASNSSAAGTGGISFATQYGAFLTSAPTTITNTITISASGTNSKGVALGSNTTGVSNFTGSITRYNASASESLAFTAVAGGTVNYSGEIIDKSTGNVQSVIKIGEGVVNLSRPGGSTGIYAYGGGTDITNGTLLVNNTGGSATGTGAVRVNSVVASSLVYTGTGRSYTCIVADTAGLTVGQSVTGTNIVDGTYITSIVSGTQINLSNAPTVGSNVTSTGTLYFGATSGTLGGTGIISGATTVSSGATIAPGNFADGTLTLGGGLNLQGTYAWEINANNEMGGFDKITLTGGDLTLGAASTLSISALAGVDFTNDFWKTSHNWTVIENTGTGAINGTFYSLTGLTSNAEGAFTLSYGTGAGADAILSWVAVPEPSTWAFVGLGLGVAMLGLRQRNRRLS